MTDSNWDTPEVRDLRPRSDRGIAQLVREGRLTLSGHNPYRRGIPVEDPETSDRHAPVGEDRRLGRLDDRNAVRWLPLT